MSRQGVLGIGIDIVENERMFKVLSKWGLRFRNRLFLPDEQNYCEGKAYPHRHYAGRFAVKEAVFKAFGTGFGATVSWLDIEVVRDKSTGAPSVSLKGKAHDFAMAQDVKEILVSLSHTKNYAVAQAVLISG